MPLILARRRSVDPDRATIQRWTLRPTCTLLEYDTRVAGYAVIVVDGRIPLTWHRRGNRPERVLVAARRWDRLRRVH